ncbi:hypothetical protein JW979_14010 [bacterium]|nr:hypothetical protein [candidate division CSSED10-310 bacterium]
MIRLTILEEIQRLCTKMPSIVDLYEKDDPDFVQAVTVWLKEIEQSMIHSQVHGTGQISALRAQLASAGKGVVPEKIQIKGNPSLHKIKNAVASEVLSKAGKMVAEIVNPAFNQVGESLRLIGQMLPIAQKKGLLSNRILGGDMSVIWQKIQDDPDLGNIALHVLGLTGKTDTLILFERSMSLLQ